MPFGEDTVGTLYATTVDGERVFIGEATLSEVDTYLAEYQYVRVVRCKDCKYCSPNGVYGCRLERLELNDKDERMYSEDFCSRAERRGEE